MTNFIPRDYQESFHAETVSHFKNGGDSILGVAPPRSGKGSIIAMQSSLSAGKGNQVLVYTHKAELVMEVRKRLREQFGTDCGILMRGHPVEKQKLIQVGSVMTMIRRNLDWLYPRLIITDECHRLPSKSQHDLLKFFKERSSCKLIGFTATPTRNDKKTFEGIFDKIYQITTWREQLEKRVLVPIVVKAPKGANLDGIKIKYTVENGYDFDQQEQSRRFTEERILASLYSKWMEYTGGKMQTICFNIDQIHNKAVCKFFRDRGVNAHYVDDKTPDKERAAILEKFYKGPFCENPIMFLANIGIFSEGINCPAARCAIGNFMSDSFAKYVQSLSRVAGAMLVDRRNREWICDFFGVPHGSLGEVGEWLRLPDGKYYKDKAIILDLGGNTLRHGMLADYDIVPFDLSGKRKEAGLAPTRTCPECFEVSYISQKTCPKCGFAFPIAIKKDEKAYGDEVEWGEVQKDQALVKKILDLKKQQAERMGTEWLRIIALVKGGYFDLRWVWKMTNERAEYTIDTVFQWPSFEKWLEEKEREKGTWAIYQRLKSKRLTV